MGELLFGTTLLASFAGGVVALLAPCCVSVMLPAYLASGFRRRSGIVAGTLVFAAGVGTVILPIGLGASALSAALRPFRMSSKTARKSRVAEKVAAQRQAERRRQRRNRILVQVGGVVAVVAALYAVFRGSSPGGGQSASGTTPRSDYQIGEPGPGEKAPDFTLASSTGGQVKLSALRGKRVLLYFQEGLTCQPCWDQITDLEKSAAKVKGAGIDQVVSITTDPANLIAQKTGDMGLKTPVLADPDRSVSDAYSATDYHMAMMDNVDGHSFLLIGADGTIQWRADYGGPPKETMYLPVDRLLADIKAGNR